MEVRSQLTNYPAENKKTAKHTPKQTKLKNHSRQALKKTKRLKTLGQVQSCPSIIQYILWN